MKDADNNSCGRELKKWFAGAADSRRPTAISPRSGRVYRAGIGPHPEDRAVDLVMVQLASTMIDDRWNT